MAPEGGKEIVKREQYFMELLISEYKVLKTAYSTLGYKHTKDSLALAPSLKKKNFFFFFFSSSAGAKA
jgi:hypothetical protein